MLHVSPNICLQGDKYGTLHLGKKKEETPSKAKQRQPKANQRLELSLFALFKIEKLYFKNNFKVLSVTQSLLLGQGVRFIAL